jgi:hypothetical protein
MSESELIAAFLAAKPVTVCPPRRGASPSMEWAGYEYGDAEQPIPPISRIRRIVGDERRRHEAALAALKAEAGV